MLSFIRRPDEMMPPFFDEFPDVLAATAEMPPPGLTDFSKATVGVIPDRLLDIDPRKMIDELRMLEHLPGQEKEPLLPRQEISSLIIR